MKRIPTSTSRAIAKNRARSLGENSTPCRCVGCNTPIIPGRRMPCKCPGRTREDFNADAWSESAKCDNATDGREEP